MNSRLVMSAVLSLGGSGPDVTVPARVRRGASLAFPWLAIALYGAAVLPRLGALSSATFLNSDAPAAVYQTLSLAGGAHLAVHTELLPMLVEGALLRSPAAHTAIQILGPAFAVLTVALICRTVGSMGASWVPSLVAGTAAGPLMLWSVLFPTAHVFTFLATALLAFTGCAIARRSAGTGLLIATGVTAGLALVGDQGFLAIGLVPLALAGGALWLLRRDRRDVRAILVVLTVCAVVTATAEITLRAIGVSFVGGAFFGSTGLGHVSLAASALGAMRALGEIVGGQWSGAALAPPGAALAAAGGCLVILVAPIALLRHLRAADVQGGSADRTAYLSFWAASDVLVVGAYVLFGYAGNPFGAHYLLPCFLSAVATAPLTFSGTRAWIPRQGAAVLAVVAALAVSAAPAMDFAGPHPPLDGSRLVDAIRSAGLDKGYADYWESHSLTWLSNESIHVYPVDVVACSAATGVPNICRYQYIDDAWYRAAPGSTFLIVRRSYPCVGQAPAGGLGPPTRTIAVDADTTILVYPYDIASRFAAPEMTTCAD